MFNSKFLRSLSLIFLFSLGFTNIVLGLFSGTKMLMANGEHKKVEDLDVGDLVSIYSIIDKNIEEEFKKIKKIKVNKTKEIILIKTKAGIVGFGADQLVYNRRIFTFIKAKEFKVGDILFSPEFRNLEIEEVLKKELEKKIDLYSISIEDKCLFLAQMYGENHILLHDKPLPISFWDVFSGSFDALLKSAFHLRHSRRFSEFQ